MKEVRRQPFQRPDHNHPKRNFISKKKIFQNFIFQNFFRTTSGPDPLWKRYVGSLFKGLVTITQKETLFQKKKKDLSKRHFSKLFLNYVWTWSSMIEVRKQPFQRHGHNHPKRNFISKKKNFQNFFFELRLDLILYERGT